MGMSEEEQATRAEHGGYWGSNPYYLMIRTKQLTGQYMDRDEYEDVITVIDLDEPQWLTTYAELMRAEGQWFLTLKRNQVIVATMMVYPGEQPYYVGRHVGFTASSGDPNGPKGETINYGIGKKRLDGHVDRIWILANGCVTLGDDAEDIAITLLKQGLL